MNTRRSGTGPAAGSGSEPRSELPHDRDERPRAPKEDGQHRHNREPIAQAHEDVESGMEDTERIGTPNNVPNSRDARRDG